MKTYESKGLSQYKCCKKCRNFNCHGTENITIKDNIDRYGSELMACHSAPKDIRLWIKCGFTKEVILNKIMMMYG